tara:strand:- start:348 stop:860 length:513 start_codon:yes stop_codon:yes gene_type:complete
MNFLDADKWQFTQTLKNNVAGLLSDFQQYHSSEWTHNNQAYISTVGMWAFIPFLGKGIRYNKFIQACPTVEKLLNTIPIYDNCVFSIMGPGAEIKPHQGHPGDHLRVHFCIDTAGLASITVGDETVPWQNNEVIIFDDKETHHTINPSDKNRIVFLFDILSKDYYNNLIC